MLNKINKYLKKPELYADSTDVFWNNEHISKNILETHLNPDIQLATRKLEYVNSSIKWISTIAPSIDYPALLDLGCGPGIYAERFHNEGYQVVGVDFSKRSIEYAKKQASDLNNNIEYHFINYLNINYKQEFNLITMIYCDYGALSKSNRKIMLEKIYLALKSNGIFIFDVFSTQKNKNDIETTSWQSYDNKGFWSNKKHLCLNSIYLYDNNITLNQTIVITNQNSECYNIWEQCFSTDLIIQELNNAGFNNIKIYGDITGSEYNANSDTICLVVNK